MSEKYDAIHDVVDAAADITLNYERLVQSRADGSSEALQLTFEQRMNGALDRYSDLLKFVGQATLINQHEGA